jgi:hypothetical protein
VTTLVVPPEAALRGAWRQGDQRGWSLGSRARRGGGLYGTAKAVTTTATAAVTTTAGEG